MNAKTLSDNVFNRMKSFDENEILPKLHRANDGAIEDYLNTNGCANYQFMACLVDLVKPKQIVELGGAMGVGTICLHHYLSQDSKLYSITLAENGLEFSYVDKPYPDNLNLIVGDDLDIKNWKGVNLSKTDLWYFDSLHTHEQLSKEIKLYKSYFRKGAILMFDDIRMDELWSIWDELEYDKVELTDPLHYTGWGLAIV